jgi:hypothetical protein
MDNKEHFPAKKFSFLGVKVQNLQAKKNRPKAVNG